jgi:hypothetical protein
MTDTDRNLENLQAVIDTLATDISMHKGRNLLAKAQLYETFGRLVRTKEELQAKRDKRNSVTVDKIASYLARKGAVSRKALMKSGCFTGGASVLDEALDILSQLGLLKTTFTFRKQEILYEFIEAQPKQLEEVY